MSRAPDAGFSLVEALVALVVLSVATVGLVRAVEGHLDTTRGLNDRALAQWVAENRLAELQLPPEAAVGVAPTEEMLGRRFTVAVETRGTDDPDLARVTVTVRPERGEGAGAVLEGFIDRGAGRTVAP